MKVIDMTNQVVGELTVLKRVENSKDGKAQWECLCSCGNKRIVKGKDLRNQKITKCKKCSRKGINMLDLSNQKFGRLLVLEPTNDRRDTSVIWKCICDCGNVCYKPSHDLMNNKVKSCGCLQKESKATPKENLTGKKFGKLKVIELTNQSNYDGRLWKCQCDCGNIRLASSYSLTHNRIQSCGCLNSVMNSKIEQLLQELNIEYEKEKIFKECKDNLNLRFDFFLPKYNICIEYDGEQHFKPIKYWGGEEGLRNRQNKDKIKNNYCKENNIQLIRLNYLEKDKISKDYLFSIIEDIKNYKAGK